MSLDTNWNQHRLFPVYRVGAVVGTVVRGFLVERFDGRRCGRFLTDDSKTWKKIPNDEALLEIGIKWETMGPGEFIRSATGFAINDTYGLSHCIQLFTNRDRELEFGSVGSNSELRGNTWEWAPGSTAEVVALTFDTSGSCKGVEIAPHPASRLSADTQVSLKNLFHGTDFNALWRPLVQVATQDGISTQAKSLYHLACSMGQQSLPCFEQFAKGSDKIYNAPLHWDSSILEYVDVKEGLQGLTNTGKIQFGERPLSEEELGSFQAFVDATFVRRHVFDPTADSVPSKLQLVKGFHIQNLDAWKRFEARTDQIKSEAASKPTDAPNYRLKTMLTRDLLGKDPKFELDAESNTEWLWHGASIEAAKAIARGDARMDKAGDRVGRDFGLGLYFAESCSKSDEFSEPDDEGQRCLLLCRVTLGSVYHFPSQFQRNALEFYVERCFANGEHSVLRERPDSEPDCRGQNAMGVFSGQPREGSQDDVKLREFTVYDDCQVYPEYMLIYKRCYT